MPWESDVAAALRTRISNDSPDQMNTVGDLWTEVPFSYFYGNDNRTVDTVVAETVDVLIRPSTLPAEVEQKMEGLIGPNTSVKKGINIMWLATFRAK
jgi:hypothetical protein